MLLTLSIAYLICLFLFLIKLAKKTPARLKINVRLKNKERDLSTKIFKLSIDWLLVKVDKSWLKSCLLHNIENDTLKLMRTLLMKEWKVFCPAKFMRVKRAPLTMIGIRIK